MVSPVPNQRADYPTMVASVAGRTLEQVVTIGEETTRFSPLGTDSKKATATSTRDRRVGSRRPDQHPVHVRHNRLPQGSGPLHHNILNNGYFVGDLLGYDESDRICLPVPFYHCFGMVMGNLAPPLTVPCIVIPAPAFDPGRRSRRSPPSGARRLYGVPTMFIAVLGPP